MIVEDKTLVPTRKTVKKRRDTDWSDALKQFGCRKLWKDDKHGIYKIDDSSWFVYIWILPKDRVVYTPHNADNHDYVFFVFGDEISTAIKLAYVFEYIHKKTVKVIRLSEHKCSSGKIHSLINEVSL